MGSADCRACRRGRWWRRFRSWPQDSSRCSSSATRSVPDHAMASIFAFIAGLVFGLGLIVAGMANPAKILGFLDIAGKWDPSLAFVMSGAIAVGLVAFARA